MSTRDDAPVTPFAVRESNMSKRASDGCSNPAAATRHKYPLAGKAGVVRHLLHAVSVYLFYMFASVARQRAVAAAPGAAVIIVAQYRRQQCLCEVLIAHRAQETLNGHRADGRCPPVRGR